MSDLLTIEDIASLYRVTVRFAREQLTKRPGFPKPIPGCTSRNRLWLKESIENYWRGKAA